MLFNTFCDVSIDKNTLSKILPQKHSSVTSRGEPQQNIIVVPDSGDGQLAGLAGKMTIKIADGKHSYEFEYTLAKAP